MTHTPEIDRRWWTCGRYQGRPLREVLAQHDIGALFAFLANRGWSRIAIGYATGLDPSRVREIHRGKRQVTSYEVLVRIADGLQIDRGLMGLAFTEPPRRPVRQRSTGPPTRPGRTAE